MGITTEAGVTEYTEGQDGGHININEAYHRLERSPTVRVREMSVADPSALSPAAADGDAVIVGTGATSTPFFGHDGELAIYKSGWIFRDVKEGEIIWDEDTGAHYFFSPTATAFVVIKPPFNTSETDTGESCLGGGTLHRMVVQFGALPNNTSKSVAHGLPAGAFAKGAFLRIVFVRSDGTDVKPFVEGAPSSITVAKLDATNIVITTNTNLTSWDVNVYLEWNE